MKTLKLEHDFAQQVLRGEKCTTWRLHDDKNLGVGDDVELVDKVNSNETETWQVIGLATIDQITEKRLGQVTKEDFEAHEVYPSMEALYQTYQRYYGPDVGPETPVKMIRFSFTAYPESKPFMAAVAEGGVKIEELKLFTDGGSRGNPGPSASGYVLMDVADNVVKKAGVYLGITTNNQAEYQALKFGLLEAHKLHAEKVDVYMDSELVVKQMKGIYKVKNRDLWPIHEAIKQLVAAFRSVNFTHVPRELNKLADAEVNETLDAAAKNQL